MLLKTKLALLAMPVIFLSGCSTLTGEGTSQTVNVETYDAETDERVLDAKCSLSNDEGLWTVTTPSPVMVHRSNKLLNIDCKKEGYTQLKADVDSTTKANMWGNIIFGGGIGAIIDHNNGSAYEYPDVIRVPMMVSPSLNKDRIDGPEPEEISQNEIQTAKETP